MDKEQQAPPKVTQQNVPRLNMYHINQGWFASIS